MKSVLLVAAMAGLMVTPLAQTADQFVVPMYDYGTNTYYVEAGVRNVSKAEFMVDTGSGYVVVNEDLITDLLEQDKARYVKRVHLSTANGEVVSADVYHLASLTIGQTCRIRDVDVVVLANGSRCILGLSALRKAAPFTLTTEPPTLILSNCMAA